MKIKEAITKAAEESTGYKKWKNQKWLRTWNDKIQLAIDVNKASYRNYLQNKKKTLEHCITYLLTYLLTAWSRVLLEKLTGLQLVKKFP